MDVLFVHPFADRQLLLVVALLGSALLLGPLPFYRWLGLERPERFMNRFVERMEKKLNRSKRSAGTRVYRGMILLIFMCFMGLTFSLLIHLWVKHWAPAEYIELFILAYLMPVRHLWDLTRSVSTPLSNKQLSAARHAATVFTQRNVSKADDHSLVRYCSEYLMRRMASTVIAPALGYLALGLPAVVLIRLLDLLDRHVGFRSDRHAMFGWSIAKLDDLIQLIPSRLAGLLICFASFFVPRCKPHYALGIMLFHARRTVSPNRGWPIAAAAGALNISLAGPRTVNDSSIADGWVGKGTAKATVHDLIRAQWLYIISMLLFMLLLTASLMAPQDLTIPELFSF